jgi:hypothetical protein
MIPSEWLVAVAFGDADRETERLVLAAVLSDPALRRRFELLRREAEEVLEPHAQTAPDPELVRRALATVREVTGGGGLESAKGQPQPHSATETSARPAAPARKKRTPFP